MANVPDTVTFDGITYTLTREQKELVANEWDRACTSLDTLFEEHDRELEERGLLGKVLDGGYIPGEREILARFFGRYREIVTGVHVSEASYRGVTVKMD